MGQALEQLRELGRGLDNLLEVVEQQQQLALGDVLGEPVLRPQRLRDRLGHERRVAQRRQADPEDPRLEGGHELGGGLEREPRLARAAGTREGDQARAVAKQSEQLIALARPADEGGGRSRQVRVRDRLQRREGLTAQLEERDRLVEVLEAVLTEIADKHPVVEQRPRRLAQQHLAPVSRRHDPRRPVHVEADVLGRVENRLARVHADPDPNRPMLEPAHRLLDGHDCRPGSRKRIEEGIALLVDLVAGCERLAHDAAMLCERVAVGLLAELAQETRRALHVCENESD